MSPAGVLLAILLALLIGCLFPSTHAIDLTGRCVAGPTTGPCAGLSNMVWENATYTSAVASTNVNLFVTNQNFLTTECIQAGFPFLCAEAYKPCIDVQYDDGTGNNVTVGIPARPCRDLCVNTNSSCYSVLSAFNLLYLVPCNDADSDGPLYPSNSTTYDLSAINLSPLDVECNNGTPADLNNTECVAPLFLAITPGENVRIPYDINERLWALIPQYRDRCAIKCPNPQYGDDYWHAISVVFFVTCILSLVLSCITIFTFIIYPDRRKFPSILILHMTVASMFGAFAGTMVFWKGSVHNVMCQSKVAYAEWAAPRICTAQALLFIFGQHAILWWWAGIALNMVALIVFRFNAKKFYWAIVAFGWSPGFLFLFISIGLHDAAPGISWPFCTPSSDGILYYPIGVLGSLGFLCSFLVIAYIVYITLKGNTDAKFWTLAARCSRPALFGLICAVPYAVVYAYRWGNNPAKQIDQVSSYLQCSVSGAADCGSVPRTAPAFNYALSVSLSCIGILIFACYTTHVKYFVDFKNWTQTRVTGITTGLSTGASSSTKRSSRRSDDNWQRASSEVEMQESGRAVSRF